MGKKNTVKIDTVPAGGIHEELHHLLVEEAGITTRLDEIKAKKTEIAEMLCTEANMTEESEKTIKFMLTGFPQIIKVNRMDRLEILDPQVELALSAAKKSFEASIKGLKAEYEARKQMIEVKAMNEGRAKKKPSYYANIDKPKQSIVETTEE